MKTIKGVNVLRPMVQEGVIRFVFIGEENKPRWIGFEVPLKKLTTQSLIQIREKVSGPGTYTLIIQVCAQSTPFEFASEIQHGTEKLVSDVRIAITNARIEASTKDLTGIVATLDEAWKNAHKIG